MVREHPFAKIVKQAGGCCVFNEPLAGLIRVEARGSAILNPVFPFKLRLNLSS